MLGFGRIGQQVARRALGLEMQVVAYDPFVAADRFRELGVERVDRRTTCSPRADFLTLHLPLTAETRGSIDAAAIATDARRRADRQRGARRAASTTTRSSPRSQSGKVAGAALDVFVEEPYSGPLLELDNVVVTPHLAASTEEAQDRAGVIVAEQVAAALEGGLVTNAVNIPADRRRRPRGARAVHPARGQARPHRHGARRRRRARADRSRSTASSPTTTRACSRSPR